MNDDTLSRIEKLEKKLNDLIEFTDLVMDYADDVSRGEESYSPHDFQEFRRNKYILPGLTCLDCKHGEYDEGSEGETRIFCKYNGTIDTPMSFNALEQTMFTQNAYPKWCPRLKEEIPL